MTTLELLERAECLFHAALECAPAERAVFLATACEGDEALRRKVEALLAAEDLGTGEGIYVPGFSSSSSASSSFLLSGVRTL